MSSLVFSFLEFMVEMQCCLWALFKGRFSDSNLVKTWKGTNKMGKNTCPPNPTLELIPRTPVKRQLWWHLSQHSQCRREAWQPKGQTSWNIYPARQNQLLKTIHSMGTHSKTGTKRQTENWNTEHWRRADEMIQQLNMPAKPGEQVQSSRPIWWKKGQRPQAVLWPPHVAHAPTHTNTCTKWMYKIREICTPGRSVFGKKQDCLVFIVCVAE